MSVKGESSWSWLVKGAEDVRICGARVCAGELAESPIVVNGAVPEVGAFEEVVGRKDREKVKEWNDGVSRLDKTEAPVAMEIQMCEISHHSAVASLLGKVRKGSASPVDGNGGAEVVQICFFLPREEGGVLPAGFVEYRELAAPVPDKLMLRNAVDD